MSNNITIPATQYIYWRGEKIDSLTIAEIAEKVKLEGWSYTAPYRSIRSDCNHWSIDVYGVDDEKPPIMGYWGTRESMYSVYNSIDKLVYPQE